ncbi:MAG: helix-turn-helix domain-containing protein [Planctomycetes bacterium]|nr:helix-turn-helix domain-containing protein [Planctomycetota bacterium]
MEVSIQSGSDLSIREVAEILGVHPRTVWRYARSGAIPSYRLPSGYHRIPRVYVEALRAKREVRG